MEKGLVSILIPCYNAEKYLDDCLSSILNQNYEQIETIIINDGSTDNSEQIIDKYVRLFNEKNKKLIKINQENQGQAAACNNGLKIVQGEFIYWQDADDVLEHDAIKLMVEFLMSNTKYDLVRGNVVFRDENNYKEIVRVGNPINPSKENIFEEYLFEKGAYCFVGIFMVRTKYFDECNPNRELFISPGGQNYQLLLPIAYKGCCGYIDKTIYNYRICANSHSHSVKSISDRIKRCTTHQEIIINTLNKIKTMPQKERKRYLYKIKIKYFKRKVYLLCIQSIKERIKRIFNGNDSRR